MRPGAGCIAPAETQQVRPIAAIPSNETYLTMDTCAGASIFQEVLIRLPRMSDGGSSARPCGQEVTLWFERLVARFRSDTMRQM